MEHDGPVVMDIRVAKESNVFPMIPSGQTINEMMVRKPEPLLAPPSVCHFEPKDTRVPDPNEVVDVAR